MITIETTLTKIATELNVRSELCQEIMRRIWLKSCGQAPFPDKFVFNTGEEILAAYPRMMGDHIAYYYPACEIATETDLIAYIKDTSRSVWNMVPYLGPYVPPAKPELGPPTETEPPVEPEPPVDIPEEPPVDVPEPEEPPVPIEPEPEVPPPSPAPVIDPEDGEPEPTDPEVDEEEPELIPPVDEEPETEV